MTAQRFLSGIGVAAIGGLLALLGWGMLRPEAGTAGVNALGSLARNAHRPAPNLQLRLFDGAQTNWELAAQRGKVVVVNFWASWCPPCRTEAAVLAQAAADYAPRGVVVVGVNVWDDSKAARAFLDEFGVKYPNGSDVGRTAAVEYGVMGIPETFIVNQAGLIVARWVGPLEREQLDMLLSDAASPVPPTTPATPATPRPLGVLSP